MRIIKFFMAAVLATGCIPAGGTYGNTSQYPQQQGYTQQGYAQQTTVAVGTGVYVNGQEITADEKAKLDWLLGQPVPAGRYFVTDAGMMGVEGQHASVNLVAYAQARGIQPQQRGNGHAARGSSHYNGYSGDAITSDGKGCTIVSTSSGSFSSGC